MRKELTQVLVVLQAALSLEPELIENDLEGKTQDELGKTGSPFIGSNTTAPIRRGGRTPRLQHPPLLRRDTASHLPSPQLTVLTYRMWLSHYLRDPRGFFIRPSFVPVGFPFMPGQLRYQSFRLLNTAGNLFQPPLLFSLGPAQTRDEPLLSAGLAEWDAQK